MKKIFTLLTGAALLATTFNVAAVTMQASFSSFTPRTAMVSKTGFSGSGGGYGSFTVTEAPAATGDRRLDSLLGQGHQFLAYCLEPDEVISRSIAYEFEIVDLSLAPTSPNAGPTGALGQAWIEKIIAATDYRTVDDLVAGATDSQEHVFQVALYEAGYESPLTTAFDVLAGTAAVSSAGALEADVVAHTTWANSGATGLGDINTYALLNRGPAGSVRTSDFTGQDLFVFTRTVPEPTPLMLIGLSLLGLGTIRSIGKK